MSLRTVQQLLVVGALAWALFPVWGAPVFLAAWVVLVLGTRARTTQARKAAEGQVEALSRQLAPESIAWLTAHPFGYVWPSTAKAWQLTWRMTTLLEILLALWFGVRALVQLTPSYLLTLVPLFAVFAAGVRLAPTLGEDLVNDAAHAGDKPRHLEVQGVLGMRTMVGQWPPAPAPDADAPKPDVKTDKQ